ncbi:threonylcarbamoyl-AMP synthase [Brachybacterium vulturis]|uniref:L-threonylcarbamoyladenylate synthase n=1 Tax=Brachybacterium vulturis TaxID=2017484 RepID=A0A291GN96_9MICO|nr:L-threonylcarbamoyladenylate synthase [Brachybacterium vulturis]ATG51695.1 threonylcarbamoyl-AMP synthase [Brachybacterium vulturis]
MTVHDTQNPESREDALAAAVDAVRGGDLIVLPTDTVYGIGADAFTPDAVQALLEAKGRGRDTPPPVLIGDHAVLLALAADVPDYVEDLTDELWPGALTLILTAQRSLTWDLGETHGTVALRMPDDEIALELLRRTGPLAVSSANRHGRPAALSVLDAATQLGDAVEIYLDDGPARIGESSTILDTTVTPAEIVREGAISKERIIEVVGDIFAAPEPESEPESAPESSEEGSPGEDTSEASSDGAQSGAETAVEAEPSAEPGAADPRSAEPAPPAASTSVLDLPAEPGPAPDAAAAGVQEPASETPLEGVGEQTPTTASEPAADEGGSQSTPG